MALALAGCGRMHFDARTDASGPVGDMAGDAADDANSSGQLGDSGAAASPVTTPIQVAALGTDAIGVGLHQVDPGRIVDTCHVDRELATNTTYDPTRIGVDAGRRAVGARVPRTSRHFIANVKWQERLRGRRHVGLGPSGWGNDRQRIAMRFGHCRP
jgi:hypothetical protein